MVDNRGDEGRLLERLDIFCRAFVQAAKPRNTARGYAYAIRDWEKWNAALGLSAFPARPEQVAAYCIYLLSHMRYAQNTIKYKLSAISSQYAMTDSVTNPIHTKLVHEVRKYVLRLARPPVGKIPIPTSMLLRLITVMDPTS